MRCKPNKQFHISVLMILSLFNVRYSGAEKQIGDNRHCKRNLPFYQIHPHGKILRKAPSHAGICEI